MIYTKNKIEKAINDGYIVIDPFEPKNLGTNSYDLTVSLYYKVYENKTLVLGEPNSSKIFIMPPQGIVLDPGVIYLLSTVENVTTKNCVGTLHGRSSAARLGIDVVTSGGIGDIGFSGNWTMACSVTQPVRILPFSKIAHIMFHSVDGEIDLLYGERESSKYQNSDGAQEYKH